MNEFVVAYVLVAVTFLSLITGIAAVILWLLKRTSPFYRSLAAAVGLSGLIVACSGLTFLDSVRSVFWHIFSVLGQLFQPAAILYVCVSLMDASKSELIQSARWRARALGAVGGVLLSVLIALEFVGQDSSIGILGGIFSLPIESQVVSIFRIMGLVIDLAYIEQSMRLLRDPFRYRLKYILIGLGTLASVQIYHASQLLSVSVEDASAVLLSGFGSFLALGLILVGLLRTRLDETRASLYIAPGLVYGSATFLVVGLYLIVMGLVGGVIRYSGLPLSEVLSGLVILAAVMALLVVIASRSVRVRVNRLVARLVYHAKYDYRAKWLEVTDAFRDCVTIDVVLDRFLDILSRTFGAPRISVWLHIEADDRFHMVRSTVLDGEVVSLSTDHPMVRQLRGRDEVLDIEHMEFFETTDDLRFQLFTRVEACVPIQSSSQLLGFVAVSRDERGERYRHDDCLLLRAIAHHVGMLLVLSRQTEERRATVSLEALHRFSVFCLHDLKNLTAGLSLVVQNATVYGQDPAFQQSAINTVARTVRKMTALMEKLSLKARSQVSWQTVDVGAIILDVVNSVQIPACVDVKRLDGQRGLVRAVPEELQQVFLNLLLNAQQAAGEHGRISIQADCDGRIVQVKVSDNGPGIPHDRLRTLFHPFQTEKAGGLGIGLYQCKRIVESHQGAIHIMSVVKQGTIVLVTLPVVDEEVQRSNNKTEQTRQPGVEVSTREEQPDVAVRQEGSCHAG